MKKINTLLQAGIITLILSFGVQPVTAQTVSNVGDSYSGFSSWGAVGYDTPTFGETFVGGSGGLNELNNFTFYISNVENDQLTTAAVYQWDNVNGVITGSPLFSTNITVPAIADGPYEAITVNTGNLVLAPGIEYVAFLSTIGNGGVSNDGLFQIDDVLNSFAGGNGVFSNDSSSLTNPWDGPTGYNPFIVTFNAVPEPSTYGSLVFFGLMGLVAWRRLRAATQS